jgi:hypothetical protein
MVTSEHGLGLANEKEGGKYENKIFFKVCEIQKVT